MHVNSSLVMFFLVLIMKLSVQCATVVYFKFYSFCATLINSVIFIYFCLGVFFFFVFVFYVAL